MAEQEAFRVGQFTIRRIRDPDEVPEVAAIQAESFVDPLPIPGVANLQRQAFKAEVVDILRRKLRNCPEESFVCLVAERAVSGGSPEIVGVVELSLEVDRNVLAQLQLPSTGCYAYVSCMAVAPSARRQGVASALLRSAEQLTGRWRERTLYLHVYRSNDAAVQLYSSRGYSECGRDPGWKALLPGAQTRLLMSKPLR